MNNPHQNSYPRPRRRDTSDRLLSVFVVVAVLGGFLLTLRLYIVPDGPRRTEAFCAQIPLGSREEAFRARAKGAMDTSDYPPKGDRPRGVIAWLGRDLAYAYGCRVDIVDGVVVAKRPVIDGWLTRPD